MCGGRVMVVIVVAMSARIEAASSGSVAVVLFAGIFRCVRRADRDPALTGWGDCLEAIY